MERDDRGVPDGAVAWVVRHPDGTLALSTASPTREDAVRKSRGRPVIPLYTHPVPDGGESPTVAETEDHWLEGFLACWWAHVDADEGPGEDTVADARYVPPGAPVAETEDVEALDAIKDLVLAACEPTEGRWVDQGLQALRGLRVGADAEATYMVEALRRCLRNTRTPSLPAPEGEEHALANALRERSGFEAPTCRGKYPGHPSKWCTECLLWVAAEVLYAEEMAARARLRSSPAPAEQDAGRLDWLEWFVQGERHYDVLIQWDDEDGFWLSRAERGTLGAHPLDEEDRNPDLRSVIDCVRTRLAPPEEAP